MVATLANVQRTTSQRKARAEIFQQLIADGCAGTWCPDHYEVAARATGPMRSAERTLVNATEYKSLLRTGGSTSTTTSLIRSGTKRASAFITASFQRWRVSVLSLRRIS